MAETVRPPLSGSGFPLQAIASGRYQDLFRQHGGQWRFTRRAVTTDLTGDVSHHVRAAGEPAGQPA
jgi:hypothetical protein